MNDLVVILGPNASGKSALAVSLARHFNGEVVSADSRQVYRKLDLGSGKITPTEMQGVKHHLIDVADLAQCYSLADYQRDAYAAIDSIHSSGKLPFLVGGTGLYISAIVEGYQLSKVTPDQELRQKLEALSLDLLVAMLTQLNPDAARHIDTHNRRRLIRAIEVASAGAQPAKAPNHPRYKCLQLGLAWTRDDLLRRIEERLDARLAAGMIDEVAALRKNGVTDTRLEQLGLEYRFISRFLRGQLRTIEDLRSQLLISIRQLAKEQLTWFKRDKRIISLDAANAPLDTACRHIEQWRTRPS